ncbi:MAG: hypothetical protein IJ678_08115 [Kiritimatiellae bacterium]|nr:hypothetical protein [Kiritimatiellia bacterium]
MRFLPALVAASALVAGCEWTSSSGGSSWNSSYDAMNFAGTYRSSVSATSTTSSGTDSSEETVKTQDYSEATTYDAGSGQQEFSGTFAKKPTGSAIVEGSVSVTLVDEDKQTYGFQDAGSGTLSSSIGSGSYSDTGWTVHITSGKAVGKVKISYTYKAQWSTTSSSSMTTSTTSTTKDVTSVTVNHTGQNLVIRMNNGVVMEGKFTSVNQTGKIDDDNQSGYNTYNAQFEVSGKNNKFVGTLNYDYGTGYRMLDGSWTSGKNVYDVHGVGSSWRN